MNIGAVILAGGQSSRMGRDKAWVEFEGQPLIVRALGTLRDSGITEIYISGRADTDYSALQRPVLLDREPGFGPLGGIERALEASHAPLMLVLAVDLPRMTAEFLRKLGGDCDPLTGIVPTSGDRIEPLAAIYPKRCHTIARECLLKRRRAAQDFADASRREGAVRFFAVPDADLRCLENLNTPSDLRTNP
jgi:molybdopterin-guanine dinucleotide biosynthesis protein A